MKMYRTNNYDLEIQEREITKETGHYLFWLLTDGRRERREMRVGPYHKWHESRRDALDYLHQRAIKKAVEGQRLLNEAAYEIKYVQIELKHLKEEQ